jgi:hypothetical protein
MNLEAKIYSEHYIQKMLLLHNMGLLSQATRFLHNSKQLYLLETTLRIRH